jgi:ribonuclease BN (tRNA processing enzyme)
VAPQKVLQFLNATLDDSPNLFFQGMTHAEWECGSQQQQQYYPEMPFDYLHSVPVNHCPDAHGLLLRTSSSSSCGQEAVVLLCYSGDCRPCGKLIRACRDYNPNNRLQLTLLLHEATFDDEESEMAHSKRHCTVSEALGVARDMKKVDATLLTHFSQRYAAKKGARPTFALNDNNHDTINYGMCQDGLWLPLTKKALSNIYLLKHM